MQQQRSHPPGYGAPWFALTVAFALHVLDEATTGFLNVYNPTVLAARVRWRGFTLCCTSSTR